jgi:hypothetical protein
MPTNENIKLAIVLQNVVNFNNLVEEYLASWWVCVI